jgi:hypothetical protein
MATARSNSSNRQAGDQAVVVRAVTVIMGVVVGLTFMFGFGNVLSLALRLGVPVWVAPLVAPAVDLSILGLLLGTRHLALAGAPADLLHPARRLLMFASVVTLALNVADPLVAGEFGKAAFDAVGPLLLIGWAEVGPGLLQAISTTGSSTISNYTDRLQARVSAEPDVGEGSEQPPIAGEWRRRDGQAPDNESSDALLEQAKQEDAAHRARTQRPISADALRVRLGIGSARARRLVEIVRAEFDARRLADLVEGDARSEAHCAAA